MRQHSGAFLVQEVRRPTGRCSSRTPRLYARPSADAAKPRAAPAALRSRGTLERDPWRSLLNGRSLAIRVMRVAQIVACALALLVVSSSRGESPDSLTAEARSPAVIRGRLVEDVGIETLGGVFTPLLERGRAVPCEVSETFSTATDNQREIEIRLFRGIAKLAHDAKRLGRFAITDIPPGPRGTIIVTVSISVASDGSISLDAREKTGRPVHLRRRDG